MKFRLYSFVLAVVLAAAPSAAWAADPPPAVLPTVKMPAEIKITPGRLASLVIESNGKVTKFGCLSPEVDVFREYDPEANKIRVRVIAYTPGKYAIFAYTAIGDLPSEPAVCWLTVGDPPPPVPPVPPTPPVPPVPTDPLTVSLQAAYKADFAAGKAKPEYLAAVEAVFRQASPEGLVSVGQFKDLLVRAIASQALMPKGSMPAVSAEVTKFIKENLPADGLVAFTPELRDKARAACVKLADGLKGVTP